MRRKTRVIVYIREELLSGCRNESRLFIVLQFGIHNVNFDSTRFNGTVLQSR
ncbi:MAG: hypothetical protein G01um10148_1020 [Parcubacteria group bacterium Gr01-1014_8]|nr:MAG: hypothetical protein G01um10148_1020 [Parcubacteria group bacterium Gr01-1014_8]